ncbi:putative nwd2 protein [Mycena sanguinolenta]|uniref:Putative nwd2 protein n=1 Tax=Mycena sanguinolenta TaxID=230812 RepID=A0A8H6Z5M0_9AGAR|nr:putative nwd2 protein [Mycena sanguinolenta]
MFPQGRGDQTMNNHISGGMGGHGGAGHANGTGGRGGHGMGPSLNFDISTGNFTMNNLYHPGIDILHRSVASAAIHNSAESFPQPRCHPETRTEMLRALHEWALGTNPDTAATTILWLWGPAGSGKSAIMQTLAGKLQDAERLGGSFFFKRSHATRGNGKMLFATIAYQLALSVPELKTISQVVENDPSVLVQSMKSQMKKLISKPCRLLENCNPITVLIDGLDECEGYGIQQEILRAIRNSLSKHPIPLRFIVASRPEPHICDMFNSRLYMGTYRSFNVEQSFEDVRRYLCDEFSRIHREHYRTMAGIAPPWPSPDVLRMLVSESSGHFIYASTIIKFIDDPNYRPPERLAAILDGSRTGSELAFDALDQLYMTVLKSSPRQSELIPILCAIANFDLDPDGIDQLFELPGGETMLLLRGLHSVLDIPSKGIISSHHASFLDFLNSPQRSGNFYISTLDRRMVLARSLLKFCAAYSGEIPSLTSSQRVISHNLIPFIISLPPAAELCPLIELMNCKYIVEMTADLESMRSWLKQIPSVSEHLVQLWEDYRYMSIDIFNPTVSP